MCPSVTSGDCDLECLPLCIDDERQTDGRDPSTFSLLKLLINVISPIMKIMYNANDNESQTEEKKEET